MEIDVKAVLYMLTQEFGLGRSSFNERLKLQKVIYLLQSFGVKLGYGFGWYKYGPYSQDLVSDAYSVLGSQKSEYERVAREEKWAFSKETKAKFAQFKDICKDFLGSSEKLELLASVQFVKNMWCSGVAKDKFAEEFKKHKKLLFNKTPVDTSEIEVAFDICKILSPCQ